MPACELFKEGDREGRSHPEEGSRWQPESTASLRHISLINNLSGVFPPPTRHWPGMTQPLTGKVASSWETAQSCGKLMVLESDILEVEF